MKSFEQTATVPMRANVGLCTSVLFILMNVDLTLGLVRSPWSITRREGNNTYCFYDFLTDFLRIR